MDSGIADTINRRDVTLIVARLDALDLPAYQAWYQTPWYEAPMADTLLSEDDATWPDRAWLVGQLASGVPGIVFDGCPADCDWDNLFAHIRQAITARRETRKPHTGRGTETPLCDVV